MDRFIFVLVICIFVACTDRKKQQEEEFQKLPKTTILVENKTVDLGVIPKDTLIDAVFKIRNTGENKLVLQEVIPECNCTGYHLSKKEIFPSDEAILTLPLDTKGKMTGLSRKAIVFRSNSQREYTTLFIKYRIPHKR